MSNDTHVREFLERMANEIYVPPLDWRSPVKRARRQRSITMAVVVVLVTAIVTGGSVGLRSITDTGLRPAHESTHPHESTPPLMPAVRNGSIDVFGFTNAVRTLTLDGLGTPIFDCKGLCPQVGGADWSPDGTRLAFTAIHPRGNPPYDGLHVVDPVRGTDRLVVHGAEIGQPAWSPEGTRIAFVQLQQIFVVNEDGSGQTSVITLHGNTYPSHPSWSPDGSRIVYSAGGQLFVVGLDGSAPSPLVNGFNPTWSPDGNTIAYVGGDVLRGPGGCDIRETTPAGGRDSSLIDLATVGPDPKRCELAIDLEWSPDGARLAAVVERNITHTRSAVIVMKADGSSARMFSGWGGEHSYFGLTWRPVQVTAG